jgi:hypothetical protein
MQRPLHSSGRAGQGSAADNPCSLPKECPARKGGIPMALRADRPHLLLQKCTPLRRASGTRTRFKAREDFEPICPAVSTGATLERRSAQTFGGAALVRALTGAGSFASTVDGTRI